eukprot:TRINITY_DN105792_c0_g1_i1.p1 TRINITY_DN105792_c0_g1~~TRINITY_DN105792_c0_g1_i1.p1  ORF type:complete len:188 (-),score=34.28 TRINITY_DN105792_c0_g1_i1:93-656(-)
MGLIWSFLFGTKPLPAPADQASASSSSGSQNSALRQNIEKKGENAYYYAHSRKFEVPPDAKVVSGPGLVTGGAPVKIETESSSVDTSEKSKAIRNFSWADDGAKVKIYLQLPDGVLVDASQATCDFDSRSVSAQVVPKSGASHVFKMEPLKAEIVPEKSTFRTNIEKAKVTITLQKKKTDQTWYDLK